MTEKRFQWIYIKDNTLELQDNGIVKVFNNERLEELLNDFAEENKQLKQQNKMLRTNVGKLTDDVKYLQNLPSTHQKENKQLKSDLKDCKKLKGKRLKKIRNHRTVIEELGGVIKAYKGKLSQANEKIEKIKEAMEDTGALTKRQLEEILK